MRRSGGAFSPIVFFPFVDAPPPTLVWPRVTRHAVSCRCVARISKLVGVPAPLALTRKFLLRKKPTIDEITMHVSTTEVFEVEQTYLLCLRKAERCRIRRRQQEASHETPIDTLATPSSLPLPPNPHTHPPPTTPLQTHPPA